MANKQQSRTKTSTSSFGSAGRISHDASTFYGSQLYDKLPEEELGPHVENPIPADILNHVICGNAEQMIQVPDSSVHLMVTSPPYNVGKEYDEDLTLPDYLKLLKRVWLEVSRVLVPGGRLCINLANLGRKPYIPMHALVINDAFELGFLMRGEIIWNKGASASASTAWGSWLSAGNPTLRDIHEYILVFSKGMFGRGRISNRRDTIERDDFLEWTKSIWTFPAESAKKIGHPAPFPVELPYRLIQLYSFENEVVLDPFMGSGQTAIAAMRAGRNFIGYELNADYVKLANKRIAQLTP
jgi:DNA modification methylase